MLNNAVQNVAYNSTRKKASLQRSKEVLKSERGLISRLAERLNIAPQTISQYLAGKTTSARIAEAVDKECRRIQRSHK